MPRIDPQQLLVCLTPLLAPNGGIKSPNEVIRLANLMEKYSKKLVSKCIYIQILKCTETDLLGEFMAAGGWNLVHNWLSDGHTSGNWAFVKEILEMLLLCPVDGNRLKSNHTPKIVKSLSVTCHDQTVKLLASKLVEQWLKIAQQEKQQLNAAQNGTNGVSANINNNNVAIVTVENSSETTNGQVTDSKSEEESKKQSNENVKYKISNKEGSGKLLLSLKRSLSPSADEKETKISRSSSLESKSRSDSEKDKSKSKKSNSSSSSSRKSSSSSKSSHKDKERSSSSSSSHHRSSSSSKDKHKESSKSSSSKHSSSSSSRDKDKDKDKEKRKKETEKSQAEKDKETLNFLTPLSSSKLQRIPKRQHSENSENKSSESNKDSADQSPNKVAKIENVERKKPSISIEVRKGDKPKTVKTLNSQFRNHGLAEEPPKPPSRRDLKKPAVVTPIVLPTLPLQSSPTIKVSTSPPPKKIHMEKSMESDVPERVGGVKLIKPKPMLIESIGFMDALSASAGVNKKDPKKRKRLTSGSKKDEPESPKIEAKPLKFYKDTFEDAEEDAAAGEKSPTKEIDSSIEEKDIKVEAKDIKTEAKDETLSERVADTSNDVKSPESDEPEEKRPPGIGCEPDGPPGIFVHPNMPRRKKRGLRWRADEDLTEIRYFELDETERTNVSKTFTEQKQMEHVEERSAFQLGRKMQNDDTMVEQTTWKALFTIDNVPDIKYGSKSLEAEIQAEREKNVLQELYFRHSINDSPHEPDPESFEHLEPRIIPFEDVTGNPDSVNDYTAIQWPAPKGELPHSMVSSAFANVFNTINIPPVGVPPAMGLNPMANPLASFAMGGLPRDPPIMNPWLAPPAAPFITQPPPMMPGFGNRGNNNFRGNSRPHNNGGGGGGGNWVRGNARRGICNQFQRTGFCRNKNCPYVHER